MRPGEIHDQDFAAGLDHPERFAERPGAMGGRLLVQQEEQYDPVAVDNTALMVALDVVTERKILDSEVKNGSISASDEEVAEVMKDAALDQKSAYYQVLINKATLLYTKARQALTIGFWLPPQETVTTYSDADKAENATQLSDGLAAMDEAKTRIGTGEDILTIAQSLSTKYPSIASILAINGYILSDSGQNLEAISQPRIYEVDQTESGSVLSTALFSSTLNVGDVQEVSGEDQSGETVIKLLEKNDSAQFDTYKDWLDSKKSQLVVLKNPLQ